MMIPALMPLTRLFVWRLAPFAIVGAQVVIAIAVAAAIARVQARKATQQAVNEE